MTNGSEGRRLRVGVCGTGPWARLVHLPGVMADPQLETTAVYGRKMEAARELAREGSLSAFDDFDRFLQEVDIVSFAVPPVIQAGLALRAARAGKHLLLEKPVATSSRTAADLLRALHGAGVAAIVFITRMFSPAIIRFLSSAQAIKADRLSGSFRCAAHVPGNIFANSPWRLERLGALYDIGPHILSVAVRMLGQVETIEVKALGPAAFDLRTTHAGGTAHLIIDAKDQSQPTVDEQYECWGPGGSVHQPQYVIDRAQCFAGALASLTAAIGGNAKPFPDLAFGAELAAVVEAACESVDTGQARTVSPIASNAPAAA